MQFVPYRDLRNEPSALRKKLAAEGELIVTVDNKPFAVMINLGDEDVQDILLMVSRLRAQMAGIGFIPARAWIGTDLPALRPDVKTVQDPYSGEVLMAFPAIQPDVAVIHALQADLDGNIVIGLNKGVDEELPLASKIVIATAEEIVPALAHADVPAPFVDAVVHAPRGAFPTSCHPLYPLHGEALLDYTDQVSDPNSFQIYLQKFIRD